MVRSGSRSVVVIACILLVAVLGSALICAFAMPKVAVAEETQEGDQPQARGIVELSLYITGGDGWVEAKVKNTFTFGLSIVEVQVKIFSSPTYETDINNMTVERSNYTEDLNIFKSITATAAVLNRNLYWKAWMRFRVDRGPWDERSTSTYKGDMQGNLTTVLI